MKKLYLFLASRSKRGIKLITTLKGNDIVSSKVTDLNELGLPQIWQREIAKIINENKMLYEPRIESASSYNELRARLKARGFQNLPMGPNQMVHLGSGKAPVANTSSYRVQRSMTRRKS